MAALASGMPISVVSAPITAASHMRVAHHAIGAVEVAGADGAREQRGEAGGHQQSDRLHQPERLAAETDGGERIAPERTDHDEVGPPHQRVGGVADDRGPGELPDAELHRGG